MSLSLMGAYSTRIKICPGLGRSGSAISASRRLSSGSPYFVNWMACISLFLSHVPFSLFDLRSPKLLDLAITKTIDEVIVYHSNRLHVRINDRRAYETQSPLLDAFPKSIVFFPGRRTRPRP